MRRAYVLRYALIPYIYTGAREAYDTGISLPRPMYYDYPDVLEAYEFKDQYMFGDDILVAPITAPADEKSLLARKSIWRPPGEWIEWFTGARLRGSAHVERSFALDEIPVYVKAGAIIPMQPKMNHTGEKPVDPLILNVFPGETGSTWVYEDAGNSLGYKRSEYSWTSVRQSHLGDGADGRAHQPAPGDGASGTGKAGRRDAADCERHPRHAGGPGRYRAGAGAAGGRAEKVSGRGTDRLSPAVLLSAFERGGARFRPRRPGPSVIERGVLLGEGLVLLGKLF